MTTNYLQQAKDLLAGLSKDEVRDTNSVQLAAVYAVIAQAEYMERISNAVERLAQLSDEDQVRLADLAANDKAKRASSV